MAGYVPGLEARLLAVSALVGFVALVTAAPEALELKKNLVLALLYLLS